MPQTAKDQRFDRNGNVLSSVDRVISDAELERTADGDQMRQALPLLRQWAQEDAAVGNQAGNVTQAQIKDMFARSALRNRLLIRIIRRLGEDDGQ